MMPHALRDKVPNWSHLIMDPNNSATYGTKTKQKAWDNTKKNVIINRNPYHQETLI